MIRDITIGQYYPSESCIHKLDPRTKLVWVLVYIVSMFLFRSFAGYIVVAACLITLIKITKIPVKFMTRGMKSIWLLLAFTMVFNAFLTPGTVLVSFWKLKITYEGVYRAVFMGCRLFLLIMGTSLLTLTTTPTKLTAGLETGLRWMKVIKVPVHEIAMMMSIALRFIPILLEETDKIMKAQQARGADFEEGKFMERVKALIPIFIPLIISAFRRASELAMAMEARCYRGDEGRTSMKPLKYSKNDILAYLLMVVYVGAVVGIDIALRRFL